MKTVRIYLGDGGEHEGDPKASVSEMVTRLGAEGEGFIFALDEDEPLGSDAKLEESIEKGKGELVFSRCKRVKVTATYLTSTLDHAFAPAAKVKRVKRWFAKQFEIDEAAVPDLGLFLPGEQEPMDENRPIQQYLPRKSCELAVELATKEGWQG